MNIKPYTAGVKKELWEFQNILFWLPIILAALIIGMPLLQYWAIDSYQVDNIMGALRNISEHTFNSDDREEIGRMTFAAMSGLFMPFIVVSFIVQLYYFTTCLFDERRDLSVYFWRSLPVSDVTSIALKLFTGALVIPAIFLLAATVTLVVMLVIGLVVTVVLSSAFDLSLWKVWGSMGLISNLLKIWISLIPYFLWLLPVYAWFMLASMYAKKAPFLWAVLPIVVVLVIEAIAVEVFNLPYYFVLPVIGSYFEMSPELIEQHFHAISDTTMLPFLVLVDKVSLTGLAVAGALLYVTYWLRVNRSHA